MNQDLLEASTQKPVDMEQFMLLEFISKEHGKLKDDVEEKLPKIDSIDMHAQFLEERIIDLETLTDKLRNGSQYDWNSIRYSNDTERKGDWICTN